MLRRRSDPRIPQMGETRDISPRRVIFFGGAFGCRSRRRCRCRGGLDPHDHAARLRGRGAFTNVAGTPVTRPEKRIATAFWRPSRADDENGMARPLLPEWAPGAPGAFSLDPAGNDPILSRAALKSHAGMEGAFMTWLAPEIEEVACGMEINMYFPAEDAAASEEAEE